MWRHVIIFAGESDFSRGQISKHRKGGQLNGGLSISRSIKCANCSSKRIWYVAKLNVCRLIHSRSEIWFSRKSVSLSCRSFSFRETIRENVIGPLSLYDYTQCACWYNGDMFKLPGAISDPKSHRDNSSCIAVGIYKKCFGFNSFGYENECSVMIRCCGKKSFLAFRQNTENFEAPKHMQLFAAFLEFEYEILHCGFRKGMIPIIRKSHDHNLVSCPSSTKLNTFL